ncbi:DNA methyltransferase, partial [Escherichia coli]|nr:DNA methyltransferase [Escherichia coli]
MSRFILGDCVRVMATFPGNAVDFILTDPPYLVGFRDRSGRTIAGDKTDEWLQPACNEMYRVLKKDALMVSFYGWNRVDRFMAAWKNAGFSVVGHLVFTKNYTSKAAYVGYRHECAYILAKGRPRLPQNPLARFRAAATVRCVKTPGLQRPFRSRRLCRAVACAPGIPAKGRRDVRGNAVSRTRSPSLRRAPAHCLPGATHPYESLSPGAD